MLKSKEGWNVINTYIIKILKNKEDFQRRVQKEQREVQIQQRLAKIRN